MKELQELCRRLKTQRPETWAQLPDLALYMDQLISYMPRQLIRYEDTDALTAAMVNNYIKDGLLPRAEGKRYGKAHLAYLTAICAMKQVLSIREMGELMGALNPESMPEAGYAFFLERLDRALSGAAESLEPLEDKDMSREELTGLAMTLALESYASKLACQRVLGILREQAPDGADQKRRNEGKK